MYYKKCMYASTTEYSVARQGPIPIRVICVLTVYDTYMLLLMLLLFSHNQVRGHRTGSSHFGAEEYPREKHKQPKVVHAYITADAIHASTRSI